MEMAQKRWHPLISLENLLEEPPNLQKKYGAGGLNKNSKLNQLPRSISYISYI